MSIVDDSIKKTATPVTGWRLRLCVKQSFLSQSQFEAGGHESWKTNAYALWTSAYHVSFVE